MTRYHLFLVTMQFAKFRFSLQSHGEIKKQKSKFSIERVSEIGALDNKSNAEKLLYLRCAAIVKKTFDFDKNSRFEDALFSEKVISWTEQLSLGKICYRKSPLVRH